MSHGSSDPEDLNPLQLALQLEQDVLPTSAAADDSSSRLMAVDLMMPLDQYEAARIGLELVRRAAHHDKLRQGSTTSGLLDETPGRALHTLSTGRDTQGPQQPLDVVSDQNHSPKHDSTAVPEMHRLGRFEILRELGRGGFGVVLLGRDPHLDRLVAIKVPRAESLFADDSRRRFDREARLGSLLSHPAIIPILESRCDGPVTYIVFAYCAGESLAAWFQKRDRRIEIQLSARILMQIAQAVQYAHQRGIVHRDLKPSNILLNLADDQQQSDAAIVASLRITDFGLAKSTSLTDLDLTRHGAIVGTPAYMAPEQAAGGVASVTAAADIYSLGVILYELLTGQPPFRKATDLATLRAVEHDPVTAPRRLRPEVPADLEAICLNCLEKNPQQRYQSAHDLHQDLERFLEHRPVQARRVGRIEQGLRWCRRNPPLAAAMSLVMIGLFIAIWQWRRAEAHRIQAESHLAQSIAQSERATRNLERSELAIDHLLNDVADTLAYVPQMEDFRERLLNQALLLQQGMVSDQADDPGVRFRTAKAWRRMGEIFLKLGDLTQALSALESATTEMSMVRESEIRIDTSEILREQAQVASLRCQVCLKSEQFADARISAEAAIQDLNLFVATSADATSLIQLAEVHHLRGQASESEKKFPEAVEDYQKMLEILEKLTAAESSGELEVQRGRALNSLGVVLTKMDKADQAEQYFVQSIDALEKVATGRPERIGLGYHVAITSINLGNRYSRQRNHSQAVRFYEVAHRILNELRNSFPENTGYREMIVRAASGLGLSQWRAGDAAGGAAILQEALKHQQELPDQIRLTGNSRDDRATLLTNLGNIYQDALSDLQQAETFYLEAITIREQLCREFAEQTSYQGDLSGSLGNFASGLMKKGEIDRAKQTFAKALRLAEAVCADNPPDSSAQSNAAWQLNGLCQACLRTGAIAELLQHIRDYVDRDPEHGSRSLAAAKSLASCIALIDRQNPSATDSTVLPDSPATAVDPSLPTGELEREKMMLLALELFADAVHTGLVDPSTMTDTAPWTTLMSDSRFRELIEKNGND